MWQEFSGNLKYQYVRLLLKDLSSAERYYLSVLRDGVDSVIDSSLDWIDKNETDLNRIRDNDDWFDFYKDSDLEMIWISLLNKQFNRIYGLVDSFYRSGANLGYGHMGVNPVWLDSDKVALDNLKSYVGSVVESINSEVGNGVYTVIDNHISNDDMDGVRDGIVELPLTPVHYKVYDDGKDGWVSRKGYFSPYTRCLFASRTEYARSVNTGLLQSYANYGVDSFDWVTSGLGNVCSVCQDLEEGSPYSLGEILGLGVPFHTNCACSVRGRLPKGLNVSSGSEVRVVDLTPK